MWSAGISGAIAAVAGLGVFGLGWVWLKVFCRLGHSLATAGMVARKETI